MSDAILNQNQNSAVFNNDQARATFSARLALAGAIVPMNNSFAGYAAIAALAPSLAHQGAEKQAATEQDLQATEPHLVGTNMSMSNNYFADYSAIAAFASTVNAKNAKIQAAAEQDLKNTAPQVVGAYEPMSKHSFADYSAIADFASTLAAKHPVAEAKSQSVMNTIKNAAITAAQVQAEGYIDAYANKGEVSVTPQHEAQLGFEPVVESKPSFFQKLLNKPLTYTLNPFFSGKVA